MNILVSGASGLIGSALTAFLAQGGHVIRHLKRRSSLVKNDGLAQQYADKLGNDIYWHEVTGESGPDLFEGYHAVINLAGDNISNGRWTAEKKARIRNSRVEVTGNLCQKLVKLKRPPQVLVCASAVGFYGDRGDEVLDENSVCGSGFLADVCHDLEQATSVVSGSSIRTVLLRIGVVLSLKGGALGKMLFPFQIGAGGKLGSGRQYLSWVSIDDMVGIIEHVLLTERLSGPVNAVAPHPVTNKEFTWILGRVLGRPTVLPVPDFALKAMFGEMAEELLLSSARVSPTKLISSGYRFKYPQLEDALKHLLRK